MATAGKAAYEELTKLATNFVTAQKGIWDHAAWLDFMSGVQNKGFDISGEMQSNLGDLLNAMNRFYTTCAATGNMESTMKSVVNDSVLFIREHSGVWDHTDWEEFVKTAQQNTFTLSESTTAYLGGILEALKALYVLPPAATAKKRTTASRTKASAGSQPAAAAKKSEEAKPAAAKPAVRKKVAKKAPKSQ